MTSIYKYRTAASKPDEKPASPSAVAGARAMSGLETLRRALVAVAVAAAVIGGLAKVVLHTGSEIDASVNTADQRLPIHDPR